MKLQDLKNAVEAYRQDLKTKSGETVLFAKTGPVGMGLIDSIVKTLELQQQRIEELEQGQVFDLA